MNIFKKYFGHKINEDNISANQVKTSISDVKSPDINLLAVQANNISNPIYDKFPPYQIFDRALEFSFSPNRYEVWAKGNLVQQGKVSGVLQCIPSFLDLKRSEVKTFNFPAEINLRDTLIFDLTFTSTDRIFLATVPEKTNIENYDSFLGFRQNVPIGFPIVTRKERVFDENEPYVCCIFSQNKRLSKITFGFGNIPRLLELYADSPVVQRDDKTIIIAKIIIEYLIEQWDDGAWVVEHSVNSDVSEKYGFEPTDLQYKEAVALLNSFNQSGDNLVDREMTDLGLSRFMVFKSQAPRHILREILKQL